MIYLVIFLVCLIVAMASDDETIRFVAVLIAFISAMLFTFFSDVIVTHIMKEYENGKIAKEYIIIDQDTTYRWVLK